MNVEFRLDIKTLIAVGAFAATMGGFYYSTTHRLGALEDKIENVQEDITIIKKQLRRKLK